MGKPDASRQFRVTEREAGTGRMAFAAPGISEFDEVADENFSDGDVIDVLVVSGEDAEVIEAAQEPVAEAPNAEKGDGDSESADSKVGAGVSAGLSPRPVAAKTAAVLAREQQVENLGAMGNDQVMIAVEAIRNHPVFIDHMKRIARSERDREFCCHQMPHLLDVARIAYIRALEHRMPFRKEVIYAAALLHDVGKAEQYEHGKPHEEAGMSVATKILQEVDGFSALEKTAIVAAVGQHRRYSEKSSPLGKLLFEADKASRPCFACKASAKCNWPKEQMNAGVKI